MLVPMIQSRTVLKLRTAHWENQPGQNNYFTREPIILEILKSFGVFFTET